MGGCVYAEDSGYVDGDGEGEGEGIVISLDGVYDTMYVEAGSVLVGGGAIAVDVIGTIAVE